MKRLSQLATAAAIYGALVVGPAQADEVYDFSTPNTRVQTEQNVQYFSQNNEEYTFSNLDDSTLRMLSEDSNKRMVNQNLSSWSYKQKELPGILSGFSDFKIGPNYVKSDNDRPELPQGGAGLVARLRFE